MDVTVDPDYHHILSACDGEVLLQGLSVADDAEPCVLIVSRATYHAAIDAWLDAKERYFETLGGIGCITFDAIRTKEKFCTCGEPTYRATMFTVDMEHDAETS